MIGSTLQFVSNQLNQSVCNRLRIDPLSRKVFLVPNVSLDGELHGAEDNALFLALLGISRDPYAQAAIHSPRAVFPNPGPDGRMIHGFAQKPPPLHLNLLILIGARFKPDQIHTGLDLLTDCVQFLHSNPFWNRSAFPELPVGLDKLIFEFESLDHATQNHIWGMFGTKYMPSVFYRIRMLTIEATNQESVVPENRGAEAKIIT